MAGIGCRMALRSQQGPPAAPDGPASALTEALCSYYEHTAWPGAVPGREPMNGARRAVGENGEMEGETRWS